ncbi:MAG: hypothetical protein SWY16_06330 [Cyanobacteriota bacterium]|nr:hypothetical protein [Cyanobacteriota bacterium]
MQQNFLSNPNTPVSMPTTGNISQEVLPNREPIRLMAIGSRQGVLNVIHTLHRLRFAEVSEWSPLLPAPTSGEVMSILTRHISREATKGG